MKRSCMSKLHLEISASRSTDILERLAASPSTPSVICSSRVYLSRSVSGSSGTLASLKRCKLRALSQKAALELCLEGHLLVPCPTVMELPQAGREAHLGQVHHLAEPHFQQDAERPGDVLGMGLGQDAQRRRDGVQRRVAAKHGRQVLQVVQGDEVVDAVSLHKQAARFAIP